MGKIREMSIRGETFAHTPISAAPDASPLRRSLTPLWLALLTLAVYAFSLTYGFVYDDRQSIVQNGWNFGWAKIPQFFLRDLSPEHSSNFYRPFASIYFVLTHSVVGLSALGWHAASVLLHIACVLLVFAFAKKLLREEMPAFAAAALWAVHPTHVEAVTWVSAAADPLMTIFLLLSALAFLQWQDGEPYVWLGASLGAAAAALLSKETAVVLPALITSLLLLPHPARSLRTRLAATLPYWAESLAFLAVRSHVLHGFSHPFSGASNGEMILTWPAALLFYLGHMFLPLGMTLFYPFDFVHSATASGFLIPLFVVVALSLVGAYLLLRSKERRRFYLVCLVWIVAPLAPVMYLKFFPRYELVHDRFLYIPTIGLCLALVMAVTALARRTGSTGALKLAAILLVSVSAAATVGYESWWQSDMALFKRAVDITPNNTSALIDLGVVSMEQKQYDAGIRLLDRAAQLEPDNSRAIFNRGRAALQVGDNVTAERYLERSVQLSPDPKSWLYLASAKLRLGKPGDGEFAARQAIALEPTAADAHLILAAALLDEGNKAAAVSEIEEQLRQNPNAPGARQLLERAQAR